MTTKEEISEWFDNGVKKGAKHMLVICDTYDYVDYPVYTNTDADCIKKYNSPGEMQRVMEVYDLSKDKSEQLKLSRVFNLPLIKA